MDELTSRTGSLGAAIVALLFIVGYRLARPSRGRDWLALAAYAAGLAAQFLGAHALLPGRALVAGAALRIAGAAVIVAGLVTAGRPSRTRRRIPAGGPEPSDGPRRGWNPIAAGLVLVLLGQLARAPSTAGVVATALAVVVLSVASSGRS